MVNNVFGLVDENNIPVAFHRERRVIERYMEGYEKTNDVILKPIHIKRKKIKKCVNYEDLYLIRYGETYIQSKYLYIRQLDVEPLLDNLVCAHDVIIRIIEFNNNKSDCHKLSKALDIIDSEIERVKEEIPSIRELKQREMDYDSYSYRVEG